MSDVLINVGALFERYVVPGLFEDVPAADNPTSVFLGGQPGCGKTYAAQKLSRLHGVGRLVPIIGDDFRPLHPEYIGILRGNPREMPAETAVLAGELIKLSVEYALEQSLPFLVEGTWRNPATVMDTARRSHSLGRSNHAALLLVHPAVSAFATFYRYFSAESPLAARWTEPSSHQAAIEGIPHTIDSICRAGVFSRYTLFNREGVFLYDGSDADVFARAWDAHKHDVLDSEIEFVRTHRAMVVARMGECGFVTRDDTSFFLDACEVVEGHASDA